ncbi:MAG TPA: hypothetical protein VK643_13730 [Burkholderiales bacterium]|jgi:hypothetical protein|nr:hypothetical protein [Burkholderiales bacterium]
MMNLKHGLVVVSLFAVSLPVVAADIDKIQILTQDDFHKLSQDLGAALSYKPLTPTAPLGITGFDIGLAVTATKIKNSDVLQKAGAGDHSTLPVPSLRLNKGLPLDIDVGLMVGAVPGTNVRLYGAELRYAIVSGGVAMPAIGIRGSYTKLTGVDQLDFNTKGVDLSISKGFAMLTPYAGIGRVWVESTPKDMPTSVPSKESLSLNKVFVGFNLNFGLTNLAFEGDRTGDATSYGAKLGFRF